MYAIIMRKQITIYDDMYQFYKDTKSKRLFVAFAEYMFEWIEPTDLKWIEKTIFDSLKIRMQNQWKKSYAGTQSHGGWRKPKSKREVDSNPSSELDHKNNRKTTEQTTNTTTEQTTKKQEDNNTNVLLLSNILSNDNIYLNFYWGSKYGIDEKKCDKIIESKLKQWITLEDIRIWMTLYNCECRLKWEWDHLPKFENWITWFRKSTDDQIKERLTAIIRQHKRKKETDEKYRKSDRAKTLWKDLCDTFGKDVVNEIFKSEDINQNLLHFT